MSLDEVVAYHDELVARVREALPDRLLGVYAGGSFALGGYMPGRSDLDVAAVCSGSLPREQKQTLVDHLGHESLPCPARGLEFVLYPEQTTRSATAHSGFECELNSGSSMPFLQTLDAADRATELGTCWYVIDRAIYSRHGVTLFGAPAREVFAEIPRSLILPALVEVIRWYQSSDLGPRGDAVLNACRALRYSAEEVWSSKPAAGEWALGRVDATELVAAALAARSTGGEVSREQVEGFLDAIVGRL